MEQGGKTKLHRQHGRRKDKLAEGQTGIKRQQWKITGKLLNKKEAMIRKIIKVKERKLGYKGWWDRNCTKKKGKSTKII